jgi:hypothetical protein
MATAWAVAGGEWRDIFTDFDTPLDLPWTMSFIARKRQQVDNLNELTKEKRPPEMTIWFGTQDEVEEWLDRVFDYKNEKSSTESLDFIIDERDIG